MKILKQFTIIIFICLISEILALLLPFSFSGSIMAMIILYFLLAFKIIKEKDIKEVSDYLLEMIGLFIVPIGVSAIRHLNMISQIFLPLIITCIISAIITFISCVLTIRLVMKIMKKKGEENE